ncbi:MAG TPA: hypothetical protein DD738_14895 [Ruminiclostridium sp.]|nr:hypothetical protein [Ruminiclostridium sp.]
MVERQINGVGCFDRNSLIKNVSGIYLFMKRAMDIAISLSAVVLLSPVLFIIGALVGLRSQGLVLNIEEKYGFGGRRFQAYEFKSIVNNPIIRKLPLLFNVLKGDMSLIGPLPIPAEDLRPNPWYQLRMSAKPGITGLWQITERAGAMEEMVRVDLKYIRERNLQNDFKILLKSIYLLLGGKKRNLLP